VQNSKQADGTDKVQPKVETKQNKKVVQKVSESEDEEDEEYNDLDMEDDEQENDEESEEEEDESEESVEDKKVIPNNKNQHANANIDKNNKPNKNVILNTQQKPKVIQTQKDNVDVNRKNSYENLAAKPHKPEQDMKNVNKNQAQNKTPKEGDKPKKNSFDNSNNKLQEIKELVHQERKFSQEENAKAQNKNDSKGTTNKVQVKSKIKLLQ